MNERAPLHLPDWVRSGLRRIPRRRLVAAAAALALLVLVSFWFGGPGRDTWPQEQILDAIRFVESSDRDDVPDGDGGLAIGPYQIHRVYWLDAVASDPGLGGDYQQCRRRAYAERVIDAYMRRYAAEAWSSGDGETIARIHNGGPKGAERQATLGYWQRVRQRLGAPR